MKAVSELTRTGLTSREKRGAAFLVIAVICISYLLYAMIIPRSELSVTTTVHYSFSGISVGLQIKNSGTIEMTDTTLNISIIDQDGEVEYAEDVLIGNFPRGEKVIHSFSFSAPMVERYDLILTFGYRCDGQDYNETIQHRMEDYMNFIWKDRIRDWRL